MNCFLSFHHIDKAFAKYFSTWLEATFNNLDVFSTSHPKSIEPGQQWFEQILNAARTVDRIFLLIGRDSIDYRWLLFEAGVTAFHIDHKVVPIIFGGVTVENVNMPLSAYQILRLDDKEQFNTFFGGASFSLRERNGDLYASFVQGAPLQELYLRHGSFSGVYTELLAYGIDSDRNWCLFTINGRERIWTPNLLEATSLQIHSWIDDTSGQQFRLKVNCELDYC